MRKIISEFEYEAIYDNEEFCEEEEKEFDDEYEESDEDDLLSNTAKYEMWDD